MYIPQEIKERKGTWGGRSGRRTIPEKYSVLSPCPKCGKSEKEIEKAFREGSIDKEKEEKILQRLKEQGLFSGEIVTKIKN